MEPTLKLQWRNDSKFCKIGACGEMKTEHCFSRAGGKIQGLMRRLVVRFKKSKMP
jgi:hypothetical protein